MYSFLISEGGCLQAFCLANKLYVQKEIFKGSIIVILVRVRVENGIGHTDDL